MLTNVTTADLHRMDLGAHIHLMDEWNEEAGFAWQPASISLLGPRTLVVQEDGIGGTMVAVYVTHGEGDLVSLRVYGGVGNGAQGREYLTERAGV